MSKDDWHSNLPPSRLESHFGDRVVRCFVERPGSLYAMLEEAVRRNPDGKALVCGDECLSWQEVSDRVGCIAGGLSERGITQGARVGLLLGNCIEFPLVLLATARLGAIGVPFSYRSQRPELEFMLNQSGASLLVFDEAYAAEVPSPEAVPMLRHRVVIGEAAHAEPYSNLLQCHPAQPAVSVAEDETALLLYTSGTTGNPKGAMLTHLGLVHSAMIYTHCMQLGMRDCTILAVPFSHVTGITGNLCVALHCASTLVIMRSFKAADFLRLAAEVRMTHTIIVPAMYTLCLMQPDFDSHDLSAWRVGGYGGAPMPPATIAELAEKMPRLGLINCYGATETAVAIAQMPPDETATHPERVGRLAPLCEIAVMGPGGREIPDGEQGELWIKGPTVARGYWNNPEATAREFTGGFWHSGDIGSLTAEGHIGIHDRIKDMINRGGYKIFTTEVENVINAHPDVIESAVVALPCEVLGERVHAFVALSTPVDVDILKAYCAERLSDYKVPETWTLQRELLPRNANGKLMKLQLRATLKAMKRQ